ncbi:MAG: translesion error-prone DNA polymerase V autoproteolytic subunit [Alphaproteobacteria bacterium]|nr:translesion error-prone DNA polymerase V autoproteolytic subunit [Alphaproteobacteria bacterium]
MLRRGFCQKKCENEGTFNHLSIKALFSFFSYGQKRKLFKTSPIFAAFCRSDVSEIFAAKVSSLLPLPLFESRVQAGFPSPCDEFCEATLDLNTHLILHKATTFFVEVTGDSMKDVGIFPGDLLIVDHSLTPTRGKIVIALLNGAIRVRRFETTKNRILLCSEDDENPDIIVTEEDSFSTWGVVTNVLRSLV